MSPFYSIRKKDGAQIYNEIKVRAKGDILIVSQKNLIFHIILPAHIIGLGLAFMALIMNNKLCKNLVRYNKTRSESKNGLHVSCVFDASGFYKPVDRKSLLSFSNKKSFQRLIRVKSLMCSFNQSEVCEHLE